MKKYLITFFITSTIFLSAFFVSDRVSNSRVEQLNNVQEKISLNILATETRFALLENSSCENVFEGSPLEIGITRDLNQLVTRIKFLENELGSDNEDVVILKRRYTLLQMKDFLLVQELGKRCDYTVATVLYFHAPDCGDCRNQSIVLDQIRSENSYVRVYWMDTSIEEGTLGTLERLYDVQEYPTLVLGEENYPGFTSYDEFTLALRSWAKDNNALLNILSEEDIVDLGKDYLLSLGDYSSITIKDISFEGSTDDLYKYSISKGDGLEVDDVELQLDRIGNTFSLVVLK